MSLVPARWDEPPARAGTEMILDHGEHRQDCKLRMLGVGTDFREVKYPCTTCSTSPRC